MPPCRQLKKQKQGHPVCVRCFTSLRQASYIRIKPQDDVASSCQHILCTKCFGKAHALRSSNLWLKCPSESCNRVSGTWFVHNGNDKDPTMQHIALPVHPNYKRKHPTLFFSNIDSKFWSENAILSLSMLNPNNKSTNTYVSVLNATASKTKTEDVAELERIGQSLHPFLISSSTDCCSLRHISFACCGCDV